MPTGPVPAPHDASVLIVDDHRAVREGLRSLFEQEDGLRIVAEAENATEALRLARAHRPDVIVLDNRMPGGSGLDLLPVLRAELPAARLVLFSIDPALESRARKAGADAFVAKDAATDAIVRAVRPSAPPRPRRDERRRVLPAFPRTRDLRRTVLVLAGVLVTYAALFLVIEPVIGASASVFSTLAVFVAGVLLGPELGLVAAVLTTALTLVLWLSTGHRMGEPILMIGSNGVGAVVLVILGAAAGTLRTLGLRIDRRARRIEAVAEAVRSLAGADQEALVDVLLGAILRTVPGDLALVIESGPAGARVAASSLDQPIDGAAVARLASSAAGRAVVVNELPPDRRPLPSERSAVVVPIAHGEERATAMVALFDRLPRRYTLDDIERIRLFAEYLWLMRTAREPESATTPSRT